MKKAILLFGVVFSITVVRSQNVGVGTNAPKSKLDVNGGVTIGSTYSGVTAAPANGALIQGTVAITTPSPDASAILDMSGSNKGVRFPQVALTSISDGTTISTPAKGLVVWNTAASWGSAGLYVNTGTSGSPNWDKVSTGAGTVTGVSASSPLSSSGGTNPNISLTGTVPVANGGTGLTAIGAGQILIGTSSGGFLNTTLTGTTNQVNVASGSGAITLSTPQNIDNAANVNFNTVTANSANTNSIVATGSIKMGTTTAAAPTAGAGSLVWSSPNVMYSDGTSWKTLSSGGTVTNVTASSPISSSGGTAPNITLGTVPIANGGTGQTTQQSAINALTGTQSAGKYLRSDGTNATLSSILSGDLPTGSGNYIQNGTSTQSANYNISGNGVLGGTVTAGSAVLGSGISGGYYQDVTNGAYRSIVSSSTNNGYYFQSNGGATTTMWIGLGGTYNGNVGIGTTSPAEKLQIVGKATFSRDGQSECCSGGTFTLALSEATSSTGNQPSIQFHSAGYHEGYIRLLGNQGGQRRFQVGDNQGVGTGVQMSGPVYVDGTQNSYIMGNAGIGTSSPSQKLDVNGNAIVRGIHYQITSAGQGSGAHGISWYDPSFVTWFDYMAPAGGSNAPSGTASPSDAGSGVTSWARRFNIENVGGYGWLFESGTNSSGSAPTVKFAINSNNGTFHGTGSGYIDGNLGVGTTAPNRKVDIANGNDGITIGQTNDNTETIQTYIDGQWSNRSTYASGCCNVLALQPDVGQVGIGTISPTAKFEINLSNPLGWSGNVKSTRVFAPDNGYYLDQNVIIIAGGNVGYQYSPNGNTGMTISTPGYVGFGTTAPNYPVDVSGSVHCTSDLRLANGVVRSETRGNFYLALQADRNMVLYDGSAVWATNTQVSDIRTKTDVRPLEDVLPILKTLSTIRFKYKKELDMGNKEHIGVIAQEILKYYPDMIFHDDKNDRYLVYYDKLTTLLLKGMQEQQAMIENLQAEKTGMKSEIDGMKGDIDKLKASIETFDQIIKTKAEK